MYLYNDIPSGINLVLFADDADENRQRFYTIGKHGLPCWYRKEWTDAVGDVDVCQVHGQNSKYELTAIYSCPPCLEIDPWLYQVQAAVEEMEIEHANNAP